MVGKREKNEMKKKIQNKKTAWRKRTNENVARGTMEVGES
jgi:hypothetical protein